MDGRGEHRTDREFSDGDPWHFLSQKILFTQLRTVEVQTVKVAPIGVHLQTAFLPPMCDSLTCMPARLSIGITLV